MSEDESDPLTFRIAELRVVLAGKRCRLSATALAEFRSRLVAHTGLLIRLVVGGGGSLRHPHSIGAA